MAYRRRDAGRLDCKVYVGELGYGAAKQELEDIFSRFGPLRSVWVARNPPGFAFVEFEDERDVDDACRELDGTRINGRRVRVEPSSGKTRWGPSGPPTRQGGGRYNDTYRRPSGYRPRQSRADFRPARRSPRRSRSDRSRSPYDDRRQRSPDDDRRRSYDDDDRQKSKYDDPREDRKQKSKYDDDDDDYGRDRKRAKYDDEDADDQKKSKRDDYDNSSRERSSKDGEGKRRKTSNEDREDSASPERKSSGRREWQ